MCTMVDNVTKSSNAFSIEQLFNGGKVGEMYISHFDCHVSHSPLAIQNIVLSHIRILMYPCWCSW
jgi:hypothetical protein